MTDIEHRKNISSLDWQPPGTSPFKIANVWARKDPGSDNDPNFRHVDIEAYKLEPGALSDAHFHKDHFELVMVWSGSGIVRRTTTAGGSQPFTQAITRLDTLSIPPGTLHQFGGGSAEPLVLLTVHGLRGMALHTEPGNFQGADGPGHFDIRNIEERAKAADGWELNPNFRAKRLRMWGREAPIGEDHGVDPIKPQLHFTLYTFVPGQENPGHFHPHSIEFIVAVDGGALTSIRKKIPKSAGRGWEPAASQQEQVLDAGDLVFVPLAGWHRYVNKSQQRCKVMALQTPHPIMHTLLDETNGFFDPTTVPA